MNREDIVELGRKAGFSKHEGIITGGVSDLERFAELVAAAAKAEENEACAKVCDDKSMHCETKAQEAIEAGEHDEVSAIRSTAWQISICAEAIRSRGQTK